MIPDELPTILGLQGKISHDLDSKVIDEVVRAFRWGESLTDIATEFLGEHQIGVATNALRNVLMERIPPEEYEKLTRWKGAKKQIQREIGIHGQTVEQKSASGVLWVLASGGTPYEQEEEKRLIELTKNPEYQRGTRINAEKIAEILNSEFHNEELLRTSQNVRQKISRLKKKIGGILEKEK